MTTPTTPTGKRLGHEPFCVPARECTCRMQYILAIEQEARAMAEAEWEKAAAETERVYSEALQETRAMERERLREVIVATFGNANDSELMRWVRWTLLADPEPGR